MTIHIQPGLSSPFCTHDRVATHCTDCRCERLDANNLVLILENERLRRELAAYRGDVSDYPTPLCDVAPITEED